MRYLEFNGCGVFSGFDFWLCQPLTVISLLLLVVNAVPSCDGGRAERMEFLVVGYAQGVTTSNIRGCIANAVNRAQCCQTEQDNRRVFSIGPLDA